MKAQVHWNAQKSKYELFANSVKIVSSKNLGHLNWLVTNQKHDKILKAKVKELEVISYAPSEIKISSPSSQANQDDSFDAPKFNINERFVFMEQLVSMVINRTAKSVIISGEGGVGKTFTVLDVLKRSGKVDSATIAPSIKDLNINVHDDEQEIESKILAQMNQPKGDYTVIKGHSSAAALYRILYENREQTIIFDDCDSVLRDNSALNLLKGALDSYDERWISWRTERIMGDSDLPSRFKFQGSIIFISNMPIHKIDEAVRTRSFKVDLSMTKEQRIERMKSVLHSLMPDVDSNHKKEALELLEENLHVTNDINFRSLMNLISIRVDPSVKDWKKLGVYALSEQ